MLSRALDSVLAQSALNSVSDWQLIVVDDGSQDDTRRVIQQRYPPEQCPQLEYLYQDNAGVSAARNTGLERANGEWIALLDSDDEWLAHKLEKQFALIEQSGAKVCHTEEIWIRNGVRVNQMAKHQKQGGDIFEQCLPLCAMSPSSIVIHQDVFEAVGQFDEQLPACEDYDLWLRICARFSVAFVEQACIKKYGGHEDQLSRQHWGMDRFRVIALEKILSQPLKPCYYSSALDMLTTKLQILANGAEKRGNQKLLQQCQQKLQVWQSRGQQSQ